jgi:hypothetical protein
MSVNWNLLPPFIQEGVIDFPFSNDTEAQEFMDLLISRSWFTVRTRPDKDGSAEDILHYLGVIREEWVSDRIGNDMYSLG